jgi:hypothetical protein
MLSTLTIAPGGGGGQGVLFWELHSTKSYKQELFLGTVNPRTRSTGKRSGAWGGGVSWCIHTDTQHTQKYTQDRVDCL